MGHDAASRHVVIDHGGVEPASPHHPGLLDWPDDELRDPVRDRVHLAPGVKLLVTGPSLRQLAAIGVTFSKEIFGPEILLISMS